MLSYAKGCLEDDTMCQMQRSPIWAERVKDGAMAICMRVESPQKMFETMP